MNLDDLKYPIGKWTKQADYQPETIKKCIQDISEFPDLFTEIVCNLPEASFAFRYRPDGWTIRQLSHHVVDSHLNAYLRHKLAYTADQPTINPYNESRWAELEDVRSVPVTCSLQLLKDLHLRWCVFLNSLDPISLKRSFIHPEHNRLITIEESISMYSWHCRHHLAHAQLAVKNPY